ncbi:DUF4192 domain-containing protein [Pseudonocardia xishanensis]|uniref:DUF4192 domain-containing protein n=1 Tax=Pseudonocardia xishanensis TaxID=630995 RepID=A0ABP8RNM5_9PSEU
MWSSDADSPLRVGTEGLLTALPVLIGFRPRESLVLVATGGPGGGRVGLTVRVDLPPPDDPALLESLCESVAGAIARDSPSGAAVVVVGGDGATGGGGGEAGVGGRGGGWPPRMDVAAAAVAALHRAGVGVHSAVWAAAIEAGAPWCCYPLHDCGCGGRLPDPSGTVVAATAVARGTVVRQSREDLVQLVEPAEEDHHARTGRAGPSGAGGGTGRPAGAGAAESGAAGPAESGAGGGPGAVDGAADGSGVRGRPRWPSDPVHVLDAALESAAAGRLTVDAELVRIMSAALRRTRFRDLALSTCTGDHAAAAEQLWAALARTCRGPAAADPAVLLAVCALARGDGALANIALERAERVRPAHRLARDLRTAMAAGWGPTEVRTWLEGAL